MNTFELAVKQGALPEKIEELVPLSFMGQLAVKAYTAKIKAMKELGIAEEQRAATLADGQDAGEMLIRIEAKIGELARKIPQETNKGANQYKNSSRSPKKDASTNPKPKSEKLGISKERMHRAETISDHPEAIEEAIARAREDEDIPTRSDVINIIHSKKKAEKHKELAKLPDLDASVIATAKRLREINNGMSLFIDHWDEIGETAKTELGKAFRQLNRIFHELKEKETKENE